MHANTVALGSNDARHMRAMRDLFPVCGHVYRVRLACKFGMRDTHGGIQDANSLSKACVAQGIGLRGIDDVQSPACLVFFRFEAFLWCGQGGLERQGKNKDDKKEYAHGISFVGGGSVCKERRDKAKALGNGYLCSRELQIVRTWVPLASVFGGSFLHTISRTFTK